MTQTDTGKRIKLANRDNSDNVSSLGLSCFFDGTLTEAFCQTRSMGSKAAPDPAQTILSSLQFPRHRATNLVQS